jgi:predicted TIM-barrel fold metal-dependent hydrolase
MFESNIAELSYVAMPDLLEPRHRKPQLRDGFKLPEGTIVVSPDSHLSLREDIWFRDFPERLRDKAPRVKRRNGSYVVCTPDGKSMLPAFLEESFAVFDEIPGSAEIGPRMADLDAEGVDKEIVFPNAVLGLLTYPDLETRDWIFKIYNQHLLELETQAPGRFYGVALPNWWDLKNVRANFAQIKAQGFKTFMLPQKPGKTADGKDIHYASPAMEPLWEAIAETGLPISFHVGETFTEGRGGAGTSHLVNFNPFRNVLGQLVFGGILDRLPQLKVVFVEAGINWIPGVFQDIEMFNVSHNHDLDWKLQHEPQHYWRNNFYATFQVDPLGLRMLDLIGADRVMWAQDYPHPESTLGFTWTALQSVISAAKTEDDARKILGGTAMEVYKLT